ncbi:hypothetical protein ACLS0R_03905 [Comamonas jiangduensis]|uniref:hypothetical protein n=1 Tax=Comamonas jiangduensis TaxID=1194168 RepID=UPI003BF7B468
MTESVLEQQDTNTQLEQPSNKPKRRGQPTAKSADQVAPASVAANAPSTNAQEKAVHVRRGNQFEAPEAYEITSGEKAAPFSRPNYSMQIRLQSLQTQKVLRERFNRLAYALFSIEVILRITGKEDMIDELQEQVERTFAGAATNIENHLTRFTRMMKEAQESNVMDYSNPITASLTITSPSLATYAHLLERVDVVIAMVDTLWLRKHLAGKERISITNEMQRTMLRLAGRIIGLEVIARKHAREMGKADELQSRAPEATSDQQDSPADAQALAEGNTDSHVIASKLLNTEAATA